MRTMDCIDRFVIERESNVLRVDFHREPDPPAPRFPGAGALRSQKPSSESIEAMMSVRAAAGQRS